MKKIMALIAAFVLICSLAGCGKAEQDELTVYSFSGENEQFSITNGVIVLSEGKDIFYGGNLKASDDFSLDITSFSTTFYIQSGNEKEVILSNSVEDMTGNTINVSEELGMVSGDGIITKTKVNDTSDLENNLYFELITTNQNGEESVYQLQMSLVEITKEVNN